MHFRITTTKSDKVRLEADAQLEPAHFHDIARQLDQSPIRARKIGFVAARQAQRPETIETYWNGKETTNTAQAGDWIVTSLLPTQEILRDRNGAKNTYVIPADGFDRLYEPTTGRNEHGVIYRAKGVVDAIALAGGFDILAPWGERQQAPAGYLICNGAEVYGNNAETFDATYETLSGPA